MDSDEHKSMKRLHNSFVHGSVNSDKGNLCYNSRPGGLGWMTNGLLLPTMAVIDNLIAPILFYSLTPVGAKFQVSSVLTLRQSSGDRVEEGVSISYLKLRCWRRLHQRLSDNE
jgi:hypothetical protein